MTDELERSTVTCPNCGAEAACFAAGSYTFDCPCEKPSICREVNTRNQEPGTSELQQPTKDRALGVTATRNLRRLRELLAKYEARELEPDPVPELATLPAVRTRLHGVLRDGSEKVFRVTEAMHEVANDMRLICGLWLADDGEFEFVYSIGLCTERCPLVYDDRYRASRMIRQLEAIGWVRYVGDLPAQGKGDGAKLYAPPLAQSAGLPLEQGAVSVEGRAALVPGADQPEMELVDDMLVPVAPLASPLDVGPTSAAFGGADGHGRSLEAEADVIQSNTERRR